MPHKTLFDNVQSRLPAENKAFGLITLLRRSLELSRILEICSRLFRDIQNYFGCLIAFHSGKILERFIPNPLCSLLNIR